ncbi:MAG: NAD-dependent DNA ligase LigA [Candidatus Shapirobacteria bacterium]
MRYQLDNLNLDQLSPEQLGELLIEAKKAYYTTGKPIMDDHTYDTLEAVLRQINPYHRLFSLVGTPNFATGFPKVKHLLPMYSQNKVNTPADLEKYFCLKKISPDTQFVIQPKCDGLSLELIYKNGVLSQAITRGDGRVGDLVTQNVVKMNYFKNNLGGFTGSIRAEIVVTSADFPRLNKVSAEPYSNPRNAASGLTQRLDGLYSEYCSLVVVDLVSQNYPLTSELQKVELAQKLGLTTVETNLVNNLSEIEAIYNKYFENRSRHPFEIDGLVIKINDLELQTKLGVLDNRPKGQVAYKFPAENNQSRILAVTWQVGPLGNITPVAQIEPVTVSGAVITNISLSNVTLVEEKDLNIGDIVQISRRGDVIPHVEEVIQKVTNGHVTPPATCPVCHTPLVFEHKFLKCPNLISCPAQVLGILRLFCQTLDIKGISDKTIIKLHDVDLLNLPGDFYDLKIADFVNLEGLGLKSGTNIVSQIQAKRRLTLSEVFDASNIPHFSRKRIDLLITAGYNTPQKLLSLTVPQIASVFGFKEVIAQKIVTGVQVRTPVINSILAKVKLIQPPSTGQKLLGLKFAITGSLSQSRANIEKLIVSEGGEVQSQVSSSTNYLITNETESTSTKFVAAKKLGIKIISEDGFTTLLNQK